MDGDIGRCITDPEGKSVPRARSFPVRTKACSFHERNGPMSSIRPMQSTGMAYFLREQWHIMSYSPDIFVTNFAIAFLPSSWISPSKTLTSPHVAIFWPFLFLDKTNNQVMPIWKISYPSEAPRDSPSCWSYPFRGSANISCKMICIPGLNSSFSKKSSWKPYNSHYVMHITCTPGPTQIIFFIH